MHLLNEILTWATANLTDWQRDELIGRIEKQLRQRHTLSHVFALRWRLT